MISSILQTKNKWSFQTLEHTPSLEKRLLKKGPPKKRLLLWHWIWAVTFSNHQFWDFFRVCLKMRWNRQTSDHPVFFAPKIHDWCSNAPDMLLRLKWNHYNCADMSWGICSVLKHLFAFNPVELPVPSQTAYTTTWEKKQKNSWFSMKDLVQKSRILSWHKSFFLPLK